jgi:ATP-binding protein involved in chromosome partitioning
MALREGSDKGVPYMNEKKFEGRPVWNAYMELAKKVDQSFNSTDTSGEYKSLFKRIFS